MWTERLPRGDCATKPSPPRSRDLHQVAAVGRCWGDDTIPPTIFFFAALQSENLFSAIFIQNKTISMASFRGQVLGLKMHISTLAYVLLEMTVVLQHPS